jgi:hypothetical protein
MEIFTNIKIQISESLTESKRSYIATIGNVHLGFASMSSQVSIRKLFKDNIDIKKLKCEIVLHCLEITNDNDHLRDDFNRLKGTLANNKLSKESWISCHASISHTKWSQLKNDIINIHNGFELAFQISDTKFGEIIENETNIECEIDFGLASYDLIYKVN